MRITESFVHVAMREYLKSRGWLLIAGEYPNGSDDELSVLSISDPVVARDNSPDPRRHSSGEIIPDFRNHILGVSQHTNRNSYCHNDQADTKDGINLADNLVDR